MANLDYECWALGDSALLLRFGSNISCGLNARVHAAAATLGAARLRGVRAIAPGYAALMLSLDLAEVDRAGGTDSLQQQIARLLEAAPAIPPALGREVEIPTRYGGSDGPDLETVAQRLGLSSTEVIELHSGATYQVAMIGFQPGFPYLLGLPERLHLPRQDSPRARVPAGSVALAGAQTGIYPGVSPGGWHLIGRTPLPLFNPKEAEPSLLVPGDRVRFVQVR